jgi:hypothetical protein
VLSSIRNSRGVKDAEGRRVFNIRVRLAGTQKWTTFDMVAFDDFEEHHQPAQPCEGDPVPGKREVVLERDALEKIDAQVGDVL